MTGSAHGLLAASISKGSGDPDDPAAVQAMQMAINLPKQDPPSRNAMLVCAAKAVALVCLDERAGREGFWRERLDAWYSRRIRKVARRARNKAWDDVQALPGITVGCVRAFVPCAVSEVPHEVAKLQIRATDLPADMHPPLLDDTAPTIVVDASLEMTAGKAAAQVGHASMLYAAARPEEEVREWVAAGCPLNVREVDADVFAACAADPRAVPVRDAGFTEVAPGSTTVLTLPPGVFSERN